MSLALVKGILNGHGLSSVLFLACALSSPSLGSHRTAVGMCHSYQADGALALVAAGTTPEEAAMNIALEQMSQDKAVRKS